MKIGIDCRLWNQTGVGRYVRNLVFNLAEIDKKNHYVLFVRKEDSVKIDSSNFEAHEIDIPWHSLTEQFKFSRILAAENLDLMHFTYFSIPVLYRGDYVLTIHDLILHHFSTGRASTKLYPIFFAKRFFYKKIIERSGQRAKKIISVSKATKEEIVDHLYIDPGKVEVIREGVDPAIKSTTKEIVKSPYILYVGNGYPHKNIESLFKAFLRVKNEKPELKLVMVGKIDYFYKRLKNLSENDSVDAIFLGEVSDVELGGLYGNAEALVMPSLMEGFGLPVLEAMQNECLVLCSDIPSLREVSKDCAIYFDPKDISDIAEKILGIDKIDKEKFIEEGKKIVQGYSWEKMARETLKVYESSAGL